MTTFISKTEDVFQITGRGCVVAPGIPKSSPDLKIKIGDTVILKRPDGSEIETTIRGIEMVGRVSLAFIPVLLGSEITKDMVPVGTELWIK